MNKFINLNNLKDVIILDPKNTYIESTVKIGKNVTIYPNNYILGNTTLADGVTLLPFNIIENCKIGSNVKISFSELEDSEIKNNATIGPFAHLRPNSTIGENCKIGNFVEIKNSTLNAGTKASHLAYVGDAEVDENCNIGCGAIFVNYNGTQKQKTKIGKNCFIGSNANIIAPVNVADNSYICAGSTLTVDTKENDFVIARVRETIKPNRATNYLKKK